MCINKSLDDCFYSKVKLGRLCISIESYLMQPNVRDLTFIPLCYIYD